MSAAKHPYDIRDERGHFVRVAPEVRRKLEAMRGYEKAERQAAIAQAAVEAVRALPRIGWLERIIRRWTWRH